MMYDHPTAETLGLTQCGQVATVYGDKLQARTKVAVSSNIGRVETWWFVVSWEGELLDVWFRVAHASKGGHPLGVSGGHPQLLNR